MGETLYDELKYGMTNAEATRVRMIALYRKLGGALEFETSAFTDKFAREVGYANAVSLKAALYRFAEGRCSFLYANPPHYVERVGNGRYRWTDRLLMLIWRPKQKGENGPSELAAESLRQFGMSLSPDELVAIELLGELKPTETAQGHRIRIPESFPLTPDERENLMNLLTEHRLAIRVGNGAKGDVLELNDSLYREVTRWLPTAT